MSSTAQRALLWAARSPARLLVRPLIGLLGGRLRTVRVMTGVARGARLELDLGLERSYWTGQYEWEAQEYLRRHVAPGDVVYDLGAHVGFFSVCAARLGARVYAFEPSPQNAARIRRQAALNNLPIEVVEAAAWESPGEVDLLAGNSASEWRATSGTGTVAVSLDEFILRHDRPRFVKIDVEGAEGGVLRGAAELLRRHGPIVLCEAHGPRARDEVIALLSGYEVEAVGGEWRLGATPAPARDPEAPPRTIAV